MDKSSNLANGASANQTHGLNPTPVRESISASIRRADQSQSTRPAPQIAQIPSLPPSLSSSPFASREPSPIRPSARPNKSVKAASTAAPSPGPTSSASQAAAAAAALPSFQAASPSPNSTTPGIRTRRSSQQDPSPPRPARSNIRTPTALKTTTLSSTAIPSLPPATPDASSIQSPGPQKSEQPQGSPRWPISPRLRSPPPVLRRPELGTASTAPTAEPLATAASASTGDSTPTPSDSEAEESYLTILSGMRTPSRTGAGGVPTLETVQEASPLGSPRALDAALEKLETASITSNASILTTSEVSEVSEVSSSKTIRAKQLSGHGQAESGNESCGASSVSRASRRAVAASTSAPPPLTPRQSSSTIRTSAAKGKTGEGAQATMTVETETVTSIPNVAVGPAAAQGVNGSLRTRPSTETIRPKKERKKSSRKQPAVTQGTATSKADIFEAKVASAVDEANTSDSEETFVYDSNPADGRDRPLRFHHSRTPSVTSVSVANDRSGMRSIHSVMDTPATATVKKSMKFVNTFGNSSGNDSALGDDEAKGTAGRGIVAGSGRGTVRLHHHVGGSHIGRWGLSGPKNGHQSLFDSESPFSVSSGTMRVKLPPGASGSNSNGNGLGVRQMTGPASPRATGSVRGNGPYSKRGLGANGLPLGYDLDETSGRVQDERTPLISPSMRTGRSGRGSRRHHVSLRSLEQQSYRPAPSFLNRFASCLVLTVMLMLVISGAIGFMFATSQPLEDIELVKINNIIASEQELMFDLLVRAHNPNVVVVTVDAADMEVFAKSPHAGTDSEWWRRPHGMADNTKPAPSPSGKTVSVGSDVSTDDVEKEPRDQPDSSPNFLLGKFTEFDNALSFEGSFFHHGLSTSRAGIRIRRPGNGTDGGSERWERILEDEFDLIVKGVLRYSLPLSQRVRSALIEGRTTVKPNAADGPALHPNETVTIS